MQHRRPVGAPRVDRGLVERARAEAPAEDEHDWSVLRQLEAPPGCIAIDRLRRRRDRAADHAGLAVHAVDRIREEQPPCERRREPVREADVGVRLGQRGRNPAQPGSEHHRPGDVAAAAEHDVGTAPAEDPQARER